MRRPVWVLVVGVWACGGMAGQGGPRQSCYSNGTCNIGLTCASMVCVDLRGDAAAGASGGSGNFGAGGAGGASGSGGAAGGAAGAAVGGASGAAGVGVAGASGAGGAGVAGASGAGGAGVAGAGGADAGAAGAGVDAGSDAGFPATLPGLSLWLDAAKGVTASSTLVSAWKDQSPLAGTAVVPMGGYYASPSLVAGSVNGLPAIEFGLKNELSVFDQQSVSALGFGKGEFLIEVVARGSAQSSSFAFQVGPLTGVFLVVKDKLQAILGSSSTSGLTGQSTVSDGAFHLLGARRTNAGVTFEVRVDGQVDGTTDALAQANAGPAGIAQIGFGTQLDVAEVLVIKGTTSGDDLARIETYLMTKYGL